MNTETKKVQVALATLLAFGAYSQSAKAVQYDPPVSVATLACPAGSSGYDNARFAVFPYLNAPSIWRMTIWCNAAGSGRRGHFEPSAGLFTSWTYAGGLFGAGWPPPPSYGNQYYLHDIDSDGDLNVFRLVETSTNIWALFLSKAL